MAKFNIYKEELVEQAFIFTAAIHAERIVFIFLLLQVPISLSVPTIGVF